MIFKLEKNCKKRKTHGKSTSKTSKLKKPEAKSMGKKGTSKRERTGEKMDLSVRISFCIYFAFSICPFCDFIVHFFPGKMINFIMLHGYMMSFEVVGKNMSFY
jgi:coproporphyrinogen III oxidase-like Fe-S oxidoreductase